MIRRIATCLALAGSTLPAQPSDTTTSVHVASFDRVWQLVKQRHYDATLSGVNWDSLRIALRPRVMAASSLPEARAVMRDLLRPLATSHFEVFSATGADDSTSVSEGGRDGVAGIEVRVVEGRMLVTRVDRSSPAGAAKVRAGMEIVEINGRALAPAIDSIRNAKSGRTSLEGDLAWIGIRQLSGSLSDSVALVLSDGKKTRPTTVRFGQRTGKKVASGALPPRYLNFVRRSIGKDVGYVAFNTWLDRPYLVAAFDSALAEFRTRRGLVIDLRGARGGEGAIPPIVASRLGISGKSALGTMYLRQGLFPLEVQLDSTAFIGRIAILVDGMTRSAGEIFTIGMQDAGRARVFGRRTAGAVLPALIETLPNGDRFEYAIADYRSPKGTRLEGAGVIPDVVLPLDRRELLKGRDLDLDAALKWIRLNR